METSAMKAIINVAENSKYRHLNGLTFTVFELSETSISLTIDKKTHWFEFTEVMIVDLQKELQKAWDNCLPTLHLLRQYKNANKIDSTLFE